MNITEENNSILKKKPIMSVEDAVRQKEVEEHEKLNTVSTSVDKSERSFEVILKEFFDAVLTGYESWNKAHLGRITEILSTYKKTGLSIKIKEQLSFFESEGSPQDKGYLIGIIMLITSYLYETERQST